MRTGLMVGGMLADSRDRRTLMLASRIPLALLATLLMVNSLLGQPRLWAVYVLVLSMGALSGIGSPASTAAVPALVGTSRLAAAAALNAMGSQLGSLGGPALAGVLIAGPGLAWCYGADAACFAVFGVTLWFIRPLPPTARAARPGLRSMAEGLRYFRRNPVVGGMLAVDTSAMVFTCHRRFPRWPGSTSTAAPPRSACWPPRPGSARCSAR
jgi:ENTS family enterobactin (siderophore) exporter